MDSLLENIIGLTTTASEGTATPQAQHAAKRMLLDALGCAFGAYTEDVPRKVRNVTCRRAQATGARVLGTTHRVTPEMAAFANGVMVRYLDYNDTYGSTAGVGHPSDYIPAVLAAAEASRASGTKVLAAVSLTYEVFCRLTDVTRLGVERWDHVINGAVASAVGAAYVLDLTETQLRHAISLSLVPNVALQATRLNDVSMWKGCASANAARNGVFAVELALEGISGPHMPFEGRGGLFPAIGSAPDTDAWERDRPAILDCNIKRFPAGYFSQGAIQAALEVRQSVADSRQITKVDIGTFAFGKQVMAGDPEKWQPKTRETADHSLPYVVASALAHAEVTRESFDAVALHDIEPFSVTSGCSM
jgi:2-methylcitrate dehydratase